jgi:zinc protease
MTRSAPRSFRPGLPLRALLPVLALAALAAPGAVFAAPASKPPKIDLAYEKYTLPNGLEVILREDHRLPLAAVNLWYHVGPANEAAGRTGFAHIFEHMMFQASGHVGEDMIWKYLEGAGASIVNGSTDYDRTNYLEDIPSNQLELALWIESDRMGFLLDRLDGASLATQQDVIRNERRQSVENTPYQIVEEAMWHQVFPKGHPYYAYLIGSHEDIQAAGIDDVRAFFRQYYCPNNASLAIVGDIDVAKTKQLVEKYFGTIPRGPDPPAITVTTPPITAERRIVVTDKVTLPRVYMTWITPPIFTPGDAEGVVAANILGGSRASRLYRALVYEKQICQDVSVTQQSLALGSTFQVTATAKPGHTAEELERAIDAELERFRAGGPTADEVAAARSSIYSGTVTSLENFGSFGGVADRLNLYNHYRKNPGFLNEDLARYAAVTPEAVKRFASEQLRTQARVLAHAVEGEKVLPPDPPAPPRAESPTATVESTEPWRATPPPPGPAPIARLPRASTFSLANGLTVYVVEAHHLPIVSANLVLRSGSAADPKDAPGLAGFTAAMLDEGTANRTAPRIADDVHALGASLSTGAQPDGSNAAIRALQSNAKDALSILADVVLAPAFPEREVERVRNERLTQILQQRDQPFQTAIRVMGSCLYGPNHPYGHMPLGTEESLRKIGRKELLDFYRSAYSPKNSALVLAGDVTEADARKLAQDVFGSWKSAGSPPPAPATGVSTGPRIVIVDKPGTRQTAVLAGQIAVTRSDPDYEKLDLLNTVLGGLFSSRINMNLREDKGYSYGAYSFVGQNRGVGPFVAGASVRPDATGPSIEELLKEITKIRDTGITEQELTLTKEANTRSLPALFETTAATAFTMAGIFLFDLPLDYYETYPPRVNALTKSDLDAVARKHLTPDRMTVVAVGDRATIEPQIAKLGMGTISFRDADGKESTPAN